ncbi:MAG: hypothetical protein FWG98_13660 [Candidatus Cloacimonetes bacterium]|nr:hypothetical protein [Candidatus Cloacimonadota bacterium]
MRSLRGGTHTCVPYEAGINSILSKRVENAASLVDIISLSKPVMDLKHEVDVHVG